MGWARGEGHAPGRPSDHITLRADGLQLARFEVLLERARKLRLLPAGADRLEVVLAGPKRWLADAAGAAAQGPAVQVVVQQYPTCEAAPVVTGRGEKRLAPAQVVLHPSMNPGPVEP